MNKKEKDERFASRLVYSIQQ